MEDAARKRKERLLALKAKLENGVDPTSQDELKKEDRQPSTDRAEKRPRDDEEMQDVEEADNTY